MSWIRHKITIWAALIFIAHVVAIFALHTPKPMVALPDTFRSPLKPLTQPLDGLVKLDGLNDPMVFASANENGFSSVAWMMAPREDRSFTNSKPAPRFLAFSRSASEVPIFDNDSSLHVRTALPFLEIALPREIPKSTFVVDGDLRTRALLRAPEIPIQYGSDVLSNTVVQIGVQSDGFLFSARIITGSGSQTADRTALDIANHLRFAPLPLPDARNPNELQWGECVFQWFTTEPPAANNAATNPPPTTASTSR